MANQSEAFFGKTSGSQHQAPPEQPAFRVAAPMSDAVLNVETQPRPREVNATDPVAWAAAHGRTVEHVHGNYFIETTPGYVNPPAPELPPPGPRRVQLLVNQQGEKARAAYARAGEALALAELELDRRAATFARDQVAEAHAFVEAAERDVRLARAVNGATERELKRLQDLQADASTSLKYDKLAKLDAQQSDEVWGTEKEAIERATIALTLALAEHVKKQRARAQEIAAARAEARTLARDLELDWKPARNDGSDRGLLIGAAFRRALHEAGLAVGEISNLTRG